MGIPTAMGPAIATAMDTATAMRMVMLTRMETGMGIHTDLVSAQHPVVAWTW